MSARASIAVEIHVPARALRGSLDDFERGFAAELARVYYFAQRQLAEDAFDGAPAPQRATFHWDGPGRSQLGEHERQRVEQRLRTVIERVTRSDLPQRVTRSEAWLVQSLRFRTTLRQFIEVLRRFDAGQAGRLEQLHRDRLDEKQRSLALVVETLKPAERWALHSDLTARAAAVLGAEAPIAWAGERATNEGLLALDPGLRSRLPGLQTTLKKYKGDYGFTWIEEGQRLLYAAAIELPRVTLADLAALPMPVPHRMPLADTEFLFSPGAFEAAFSLPEGGAASYYRRYGREPIALRAQPVIVKRRVSRANLGALLNERARPAQAQVQLLGRLWLLTRRNLAMLPAPLAQTGQSWSNEATRGLPERHQDDWEPGFRGLHVYPILDEVPARLLALGSESEVLGWALETFTVLAQGSSLLSNERGRRLRFLLRRLMGREDPALLELFLMQLEDLGAFDRLFAVMEEEYFGNEDLRPLMALAVRTRYRNHWRFGTADAKSIGGTIVRKYGALLNHGFDVERQLVLLRKDESKAVRVGGVVADVDDYYAETGKTAVPTKETLRRLEKPVREKMIARLSEMMCSGEAQVARNELIASVMREAADELHLDPEKDFVPARIQKSVRVLALESRIEEGVPVVWVTFQEVARVRNIKHLSAPRQVLESARLLYDPFAWIELVSDDKAPWSPWEAIGPVRLRREGDFDGVLQAYHLQHLVNFLEGYALATGIFLGGFFIVELGIATATQLLVAISVRELLYLVTHSGDEIDLNEALLEALKGCIDVIGFRVGGKMTQLLGGAVPVLNQITGQALIRIGARYLIARGFGQGIGMGTAEVANRFLDDLFRLAHCKRGEFSSPEQYLLSFGFGAGAALLIEFAAVPVLAPLARGTLQKLKGLGPAVRALRDSGRSLPELALIFKEGEAALENSMKAALKDGAFVQRFIKALHKQAGEVLATIGREYKSRTYQAALELFELELSGEAREGLRRLLRFEGGAPEVAKQLVESGMTERFLNSLGTLDPKSLSRLVKRGAPDALLRSVRGLEQLAADAALSATGDLVAHSGQTIEVLTHFVAGEKTAVNKLALYNTQILSKEFDALTARDLMASEALQKRLFEDALAVQRRQQALADRILAKMNSGGSAKSILKRPDLDAFVDGVLEKVDRNSYQRLEEMTDIVRGRFDMPNWKSAEEVVSELEKLPGFDARRSTRVKTIVYNRKTIVQYPRRHVIIVDPDTAIAHEWQVGPLAASQLYEAPRFGMGEIPIPRALKEAAERLKKRFNPDLHDIEYDVFRVIEAEQPAIATRHGIPAFRIEVAVASNEAFERGAEYAGTRELEDTIKRLHATAGAILEALVEGEGGEWVARFFH